MNWYVRLFLGLISMAGLTAFAAQTREMLWEGDVIDCYGRCVDFMRLHGIEIWMLDRQTPGLHCRLESPGKSELSRDSGESDNPPLL